MISVLNFDRKLEFVSVWNFDTF